MPTRVMPDLYLIRLDGYYTKIHISLDGETPLCGQRASTSYIPSRRRKANCKNCKDIVARLQRKLERN